MTVSQRTPYLYGRSVVDVAERRQRGGVRSVAPGELSDAARHADLRQADYYQDVLDDLRRELEAELAHHYAALAAPDAEDEAPSVRRARRIISVKETELAELDRLTAALTARFP